MSAASPAATWVGGLLGECAQAIAEKDTAKVQHLLRMLNELCSPYGDCSERLGACFLQVLFCRVAGSGPRSHAALCAAAERSASFESMRRTMLKFQECSPWTTFGHAAANGAILEAVEGEPRVHILDLSDTFCTQWPTLLESLATRPEGAPLRLRITCVLMQQAGAAPDVSSPYSAMMREVGTRLEKFARLMGVPFDFHLIDEQQLLHERYHAEDGAALVVNCVQALHRVAPSHRPRLLSMLHSLSPKILTLVEDDVDLGPSSAPCSSSSSSFAHDDVEDDADDGFLRRFCEALRFYSLFYESLDESFPRTSNERLTLERVACRRLMASLACDEAPRIYNRERREKAAEWHQRLHVARFTPKPFTEDVLDDVKALLKRYKDGWNAVPTSELLSIGSSGLSLTWKDESVIFASTWKP